jgi:hypothetical protein
MLLALIGMRPEEVCGLRWAEDVDLDRETLTISNVRTLVWTEQGAQVVEKDPKTDAGKRTLPLPAPVVDSLRRFKATQAAERLAAGETYEASGYVLGRRARPPVQDRSATPRCISIDAASQGPQGEVVRRPACLLDLPQRVRCAGANRVRVGRSRGSVYGSARVRASLAKRPRAAARRARRSAFAGEA